MQSNGISLISLSQGVGLAKSTLSKIINGRTAKPDPETIDSICNYLGIKRADIITYDNTEVVSQDFDIKNLRLNLIELMKENEILSSAELSSKSGVSKNGIDRILNGEIKNKPYSKTLYGLANYFGISISALKGIDPLPQPILKEQTNRIICIKSSRLEILALKELPRNSFRYINYHSKNFSTCFAIDIDSDDYFPHFKNGTIAIADKVVRYQHNDYVIASVHGYKIDLFIIQNDNLKSLSGLDFFKAEQSLIIGTIIEVKFSSF